MSQYVLVNVGVNGERSISIKGYSYDPDCMYVNGTGRDYYEFYIQLNRCGTLGENTHHQDSRKNPTVRNADMCVYTATLQSSRAIYQTRMFSPLVKTKRGASWRYSLRGALHLTNSNCCEKRLKIIILFNIRLLSREE